MKEEGQTLNDNVRISELEEDRKRLKISNEKREKDFEAFMKELESFSEATSNLGDEDEFKKGLKAYVGSVDIDQDSNGTTKARIIELPNIMNLEDRKTRLTESIFTSDKKEKQYNANIKKIDIAFYEPGEMDGDESSAQNNNNDIRQQYCENLRRFFEKNIEKENNEADEFRKRLDRENKKREVSRQIQDEIQKISGISNEKYINDKIPVKDDATELEAKRKQQWLWKQKEIAALKQFIKTNTPLEKDVSEKVEVVQNAEKGSRMANDLQQKREMMTKATERRDDDFKKFMQDLQTFSSTPSATADEDTFKSGIQSYLKLIDEDTESNYQNVELPTINLPSRLDTLKGKLEGASNDEDKNKKRRRVRRGKNMHTKKHRKYCRIIILL